MYDLLPQYILVVYTAHGIKKSIFNLQFDSNQLLFAHFFSKNWT